MKNPCAGLLLLLVPIILSGCKAPVFQTPLADPGSTIVPKRLIGSWRAGNSTSADFKILAADKDQPPGMIYVEQIFKSSKPKAVPVIEQFIAFAVPVKNTLIIHIPVRTFEMEKAATDDGYPFLKNWDSKQVAGFLLCRVKFHADNVIEFSYANGDYVDKLIFQKKLRGARTWDQLKPLIAAGNAKENQLGELVVTLTKKELREFVEENLITELFRHPSRTLIKISGE